MEKAFRLLSLAMIEFPPGTGQHHALFIENGILNLCLFMGDKWQTIRFDGSGDLEKEPEIIINEIKLLFNNQQKN
jgi:hypothetical protein